jgi:hypothetical protein
MVQRHQRPQGGFDHRPAVASGNNDREVEASVHLPTTAEFLTPLSDMSDAPTALITLSTSMNGS